MSQIILPEAATDGIKFEKLSSKYDLISTESVVNLMREEGFTVTQTNTLKPRKRDPRMVRHFVRMRHESYLKEINGSVPEIMVINANDGSSSLRMEAGLFRFVCSNGLIVKSQEIASARIRHVDVTAERVLEEANKVIKSAQEAARRVDIFKQRVLSKNEEVQFSVLASALWVVVLCHTHCSRLVVQKTKAQTCGASSIVCKKTLSKVASLVVRQMVATLAHTASVQWTTLSR